MGKQTFEIGFLCRESKANRFGNAPIEMSIVINQKRTYLRLQMKCKPEEFKIAMKGKGFSEIQEYCTDARKKVDTLVLEMARKDIPLTAEMLKQFFQNGGVSSEYTLGNLFDEYIGLLKKREGRDLSHDTFNRYVKTTIMFMEHNNLTKETPAKMVGLNHLLNYQAELNKTLDPATSCNYLQKIKTIFKYGFETGKLPSNPAYGLKIDKGVKDTVLWLTPEELDKIKNHKFKIDRLQKVADTFLFSCYTGLSIGDIQSLTKEDYQLNKYGQYFINKQRIKTGVRFCTILLDESEAIARKYDFQLPVISSQKTNAYLKEIGDICEIEKPIHFHVARHTAAAYFINHRPAIPNETIQRIMGWEDGRMLRHYATIFNTTVFEDINRAFGVRMGNHTTKPHNAPTAPEIGQEMDDVDMFKKIIGIE